MPPDLLKEQDSTREVRYRGEMEDLNMLDELWVEEGEACELVLVEVHHEQLVGGCELCALTGELAVKV